MNNTASGVKRFIVAAAKARQFSACQHSWAFHGNHPHRAEQQWRMIMTTMQMFAIVALAALSFGMGTAMAQSETAGETGVPFWTLNRQAEIRRQLEGDPTTQAGSPDIEARPAGRHAVPFNGDYSSLANPN
jgi:hypothetical protein